MYLKDEICILGFDLWQVKSGTIFGNILITDDMKLAKEIGDTVWKPMFVSNNFILMYEKKDFV